MSIDIGVVVTDTYRPGDGDRDTAPLIAALRARGITAEPVVWHAWDPRRDGGFRMLVLRTPWDYSEREEEFRAWLQQAGQVCDVQNPPQLVRWNLDKVYLKQLQQAGVATVPTAWAADQSQLTEALVGHGQQWVVVKPTISAGALNTGLLRADSAEARDLGRRILDRGRTVMVQPEVPELSAGREKALYFIDGVFTHAIAKGALLARGGGFRGGSYQEDPQPVEASPAEQAFGVQVLNACAAAAGTPVPLYGRIDVVSTAEWGTVLLEAELFEPALNLHRAPHAAVALAEAVSRRLEQSAAQPVG